MDFLKTYHQHDSVGEEQEKPRRMIERISISPEVKNTGESVRNSTIREINRRIDLLLHRIFVMKVASLAASIALILGITGYVSYQRGYLQQNSQWVELENRLGTKSSVVLSDGTEVILNAGTILKYPAVFTTGDREVEVTGEAFFDVAHDANRSFVVKTELVSIRVFGTKFNVKSYQEDDCVEVSLEEGSVEVNLDQQATIKMTPDEQVIFNKSTQQISRQKVEIEHYVAWKDGKIYFRNTYLEDIAKQLERTFNVQIVINSERLKRTSFTGDFVRGENLEQILRIMTADKRMSYQIENDRIYIKE